MDLCAEMLLKHLGGSSASGLSVERACPAYRRRFTRIPILGRRGAARNADRVFNRFRVYPRFARSIAGQFDFFHVCDHSYAHLLHALPERRAGVYCHDLDAFRCLLEPDRDPRPRWYRALMRRILTGFQKAAVVFCSTHAVRAEIVSRRLIDPERIIFAPYGIAEEFCPAIDRTGREAHPQSAAVELPYVLHVGSCIPRKRIDVLLDVFANVRQTEPALQLVQIGGEWTRAQREQIERLNLWPALRQMRGITRHALADYYRRAAVVLQPSSAEGFGLPIVEALACGAVVVASDIPVLREVGGDAAIYAPVGDVNAWAATVRDLLRDPARSPTRSARLAWSGRFSWSAQARTIADAYLRLAK
jgi:glycosyltransferase involved in cell wall biosynthesis